MTLLELSGIEKAFFGVKALKGVSLALRGGEVLGLVGENGAGKSTLMNVLGGVVRPDAGCMRLAGAPFAPRGPADAAAAGIAFIHQELNLFPNLDIADNLFLDRYPRRWRLPWIDRRTLRARTREALSAVGLDLAPHLLVEKLTQGERQLVEIAKSLRVGARVFIFDEPTTSLASREIERLRALIARLRAEGKAIVYISHVLSDVLSLSDAIAVMRDGALVSTGARAEYTIPRMIACMVGRDLTQLYPPRKAKPSPDTVLAVRGLSQPGIVRDVGFALHKGEVLGVFGLMGSGRSELARILFGLDPCAQGSVAIGGARAVGRSPGARIRAGMAFVTENRREEGLLMEGSVADNLSLASLPRFRAPRTRLLNGGRLGAAVGRLIERLRIKTEAPRRQLVKQLSGGNQQKVVIGKWLMLDPRVLMLDEPTRGIDVGAKYDVYALIDELAAAGAGVLCISSELDELVAICDRILVMRRGEVKGSFDRVEFDKERILLAAFGQRAPGTGAGEGAR